MRRRRLVAAALALLLVVMLVVGVVALAVGGGSPRGKAAPTGIVSAAGARRAAGARSGGSAPAKTAAGGAPSSPAGAGSSGAPAAVTVARAKPVRAAPAPGSLPQTDKLPSSGTTRFRELMASLWAGVGSGSVTPALPAFFPKGAYVQLKAVGSPGGDWSERLVRDYALDIAAAHRLLGAGASSARLIAVHVPSGFAHWVPPGVCYNSVGYYELPNARVLYSVGGRVSSFGIASMISWRGVWYVVHLGAILREGSGGVVDEPAEGGGSSAYSGTC